MDTVIIFLIGLAACLLLLAEFGLTVLCEWDEPRSSPDTLRPVLGKREVGEVGRRVIGLESMDLGPATARGTLQQFGARLRALLEEGAHPANRSTFLGVSAYRPHHDERSMK